MQPGPAAGHERPGRRGGFTGRAAVLALVVCATVLILAYPLRGYLGQRAEIAELERTVAAQEQRVARLAADRERWSDPAYVRAQARERLHYVMPGETQYVVLEPDEAPAPAATPPAAQPASPDGPWYARLWSTVEEAADAGPAAR